MADDWETVFTKKYVGNVSLTAARLLSGKDPTVERDRYAFGSHIGLTHVGVQAVERCNGPDDSKCDLLGLDPEASNTQHLDPGESTDIPNATFDTSAAQHAKNKWCTPKPEELKSLLDGVRPLDAAKMFHRWNYLQRPLTTPKSIVEKKKTYANLSLLITTVFNQHAFVDLR